MSSDLSSALRRAAGSALRQADGEEIAYLAVTGKVELALRDRVAWALQRGLPDDFHVSREWNRLDLSVHDQTGKPVLATQAKAVYGFDFFKPSSPGWHDEHLDDLHHDLVNKAQRKAPQAELLGMLFVTYVTGEVPDELNGIVKYSKEINATRTRVGTREQVRRQKGRADRAVWLLGEPLDPLAPSVTGRVFGLDVEVAIHLFHPDPSRPADALELDLHPQDGTDSAALSYQRKGAHTTWNATGGLEAATRPFIGEDPELLWDLRLDFPPSVLQPGPLRRLHYQPNGATGRAVATHTASPARRVAVRGDGWRSDGWIDHQQGRLDLGGIECQLENDEDVHVVVEALQAVPLVCGTCPYAVMSGMCSDQGGGRVAYCMLTADPGTVDPVVDLVAVGSPACSHHPQTLRPSRVLGPATLEGARRYAKTAAPTVLAHDGWLLLWGQGGTSLLAAADGRAWRIAPREAIAALEMFRDPPGDLAARLDHAMSLGGFRPAVDQRTY